MPPSRVRARGVCADQKKKKKKKKKKRGKGRKKKKKRGAVSDTDLERIPKRRKNQEKNRGTAQCRAMAVR